MEASSDVAGNASELISKGWNVALAAPLAALQTKERRNVHESRQADY